MTVAKADSATAAASTARVSRDGSRQDSFKENVISPCSTPQAISREFDAANDQANPQMGYGPLLVQREPQTNVGTLATSRSCA